jgi:hypothetical protein
MRHQERMRKKEEIINAKKEEEHREEEERRREEIHQRIAQQQRMQQLLQYQIQETLRNRIRDSANHHVELNQFHEYQEVTQEISELKDIGLIKLLRNETGFEPIDGEVNVIDFVNENKTDNIAFKVGERYYLVNRSRFHDMISLGLKDNAVFYGCSCEIEGNWTNPQTWAMLQHVVLVKPIYINVQHLGLPIRYVTLTDIRAVLDSEYNFFQITKPEDYNIIPSFVSDNILNHGIGSMSGIHCQSGQEDIIYSIETFTPEIIE